MASKRNSRVYMDETAGIDKVVSNTSSVTYRSRRNSRNSIKEEYLFHGAAEMEELQRTQASMWDKASFSSQSQSSSSSESETSSIVSRTETSYTISSLSIQLPPQPTFFPSPPLEGRPLNFGVVIPGVYRSSYPKPHDYEYIKGLKLKTVVTLVKKDEYDDELQSFVTDNGMRHVRIHMQGTKKEVIPLSTMSSILQVLFDQRNQPALLHCNHGKHRTGCVVAVARKLSGWELESVLDEYRSYAVPKVRECDLDYITAFQTATVTNNAVPARFSHMQVRTFFRTLLFSALVMAIWFVSGAQINSASVGSRSDD